MIRILRKFSKDIKSFGLNPENYVKRTGQRSNKEPISFDPKPMKELFGEDFQTPYEKYDLHLPKSELPNQKSLYERLNEKEKFKSAKKMINWSIFFAIITSLIAYRVLTKDQIEAEKSEKERRDYNQLVNQVDIHNKKLFDIRRKDIENIKKKRVANRETS